MINKNGVLGTAAGNRLQLAEGEIPAEGVPATSAKLGGPYGSPVFDSNGHMYFIDRSSDNAGRMVRKVDAVTGLISTVVNRNNTVFRKGERHSCGIGPQAAGRDACMREDGSAVCVHTLVTTRCGVALVSPGCRRATAVTCRPALCMK